MATMVEVIRDSTDEKFAPPSPNLVQNQSFQDSGSEPIPSISSSTQNSTKIDSFDYIQVLFTKLKPEWCDSELKNSNKLTDTDRLTYIYQRFLDSDMRLSFHAGVLPDTLNQPVLPGPFILQVDDAVDICSSPRCLLLSMTDGVRSVPALEIRHIEALEDFPPVGLKVVVRDASLINGLLMLVPEGFKVLGGIVEYLEIKRWILDEEEPNMLRRVERMQAGIAHSSIWELNGVGVPTIADLLALRDAYQVHTEVADAAGFDEINDATVGISKIKLADQPPYDDASHTSSVLGSMVIHTLPVDSPIDDEMWYLE